MMAYAACHSCRHQWTQEGPNFNINACPICKATGVGRLVIGGDRPWWFVGSTVPVKEENK